MKKMSFKITTTLKDKLALMSKIYMSNRKSGIYPMAVMADRKGFFHCCSIADTLSISRVVPAGIDNMSRTTPSGNMIASSGSSGIIPSSSEPNLYESVSAILQQ